MGIICGRFEQNRIGNCPAMYGGSYGPSENISCTKKEVSHFFALVLILHS